MALRRLTLDTSFGQLVVAGGSRAGEGTLLLLPQLRLALDVGRTHRALPAMHTVLVSHGHSDHLAGLAYWAGQRALSSLGPGTVLTPAAIAADVAELLRVHGRLEGDLVYDVTVRGLAAGDRVALRRDLELAFFATDHRVPTLGCELVLLRSHLRDELKGLPGAEIARRRAAGEAVERVTRSSLLAYGADSGPGLAAAHPEVLAAEVLLVECTYFAPGDLARARDYGHTHLDDLVAVANRLRCRHLVLLHASRRHRLAEVESYLARQLAPLVAATVHHLVVEWE